MPPNPAVLTLLYGEKIKEVEMDGACSAHERDEECIHNFIRKTEGSYTPLERHKHRSDYNIKIYIF
jgi:hypothetical protein